MARNLLKTLQSDNNPNFVPLWRLEHIVVQLGAHTTSGPCFQARPSQHLKHNMGWITSNPRVCLFRSPQADTSTPRRKLISRTVSGDSSDAALSTGAFLSSV